MYLRRWNILSVFQVHVEEHYSEPSPEITGSFLLQIVELLPIFLLLRETASLRCSFYSHVVLLACCILTQLAAT